MSSEVAERLLARLGSVLFLFFSSGVTVFIIRIDVDIFIVDFG